MQNRLPWIVVLIAIACGLFFYFHHAAHHSTAPAEEAVVVDAARVTQGNIPIQAHAIGTLVAANNVQITPEIAGHIEKIFFADGGVFVKKDTPLIQLDSASYQAQAESDKANLLYSQTDYQRKVHLGAQGAISRQAIDQALADLKTKQAAAQQSAVALKKMLLRAPFDGVLGKINVSPGDYVTVGQSLVSLTDIQHLHVEYSVSEMYLPQLKIGQTIYLTAAAYPGKKITGTVSFISPTINTTDRTIALYAEVPNVERALTAGLFVNVVQELGMENQALLVPAASLVPTIDGQQVYKIVNNHVQAVTVTIGQRLQNTVQILSGLQPNDVIVVAGQQKLKEGMLVKIGNKL